MTKFGIDIRNPMIEDEWIPYCREVYLYDFMSRAEVEASMLESFWPGSEFRVVPVAEEPTGIVHQERWL